MAIVVVCCVVLAHIAYTDRYLILKRPATPSNYLQGQKIDDNSKLEFRNSPKTLILATSSTCHFCSNSMPYYRKLFPMANASGTRVVALAMEDPDTNQKYLSKNNIKVDAIVAQSEQHLHITGTPTLILVKNDGTVLNSWVGQLDTNDEAVVQAAVVSRSQ